MRAGAVSAVERLNLAGGKGDGRNGAEAHHFLAGIIEAARQPALRVHALQQAHGLKNSKR